MRWIYLAVIILFAAATIIFALQNFEIVTMSFGLDARVPLALLAAVAYLLGAATAAACLRCCVDRMKGRNARPEWISFHLQPKRVMMDETACEPVLVDLALQAVVPRRLHLGRAQKP